MKRITKDKLAWAYQYELRQEHGGMDKRNYQISLKYCRGKIIEAVYRQAEDRGVHGRLCSNGWLKPESQGFINRRWEKSVKATMDTSNTIFKWNTDACAFDFSQLWNEVRRHMSLLLSSVWKILWIVTHHYGVSTGSFWKTIITKSGSGMFTNVDRIWSLWCSDTTSAKHFANAYCERNVHLSMNLMFMTC